MSQNTSHAVMSQRAEPPDSLDDFPTQPWGTRALLKMLEQRVWPKLETLSCWEPAANRGFMFRPLAEKFAYVQGSDVHDYGAGFLVRDFLMAYRDDRQFDWIITNPPFRLGQEFALAALERARFGCAILTRLPFLESIERWNSLYSKMPPTFIFQFVERLPMVRGRCLKEASTATAYCWLVWFKPHTHAQTLFDWIPPCRAELERADDYVQKVAGA